MIRSALIGYGYWGRILAKYIRSSEQFELAKILDRHSDPSELNVVDIDSIAFDDDLSAVFIATPTDSHFEIALKMLESGKHVFCEKPATKSSADWDKLKSIADKSHLSVFVDYPHAYSPSLRFAKKKLHEIGPLRHIDATITQFGKFYPDESCFETIGLHPLSSILALTGSRVQEASFDKMLSRVNGICVYGTSGIVLDSGVHARIDANLVSEHRKRELVIYGENGCISINAELNPSIRIAYFDLSSSNPEIEHREQAHLDESNNLELVLSDFYHSIESGPSSTNARITSEVQRWLDASRVAPNI